jgi:hypothetical protein
MTIININPEQIFAKAKSLHAKINEFYDRSADALQGINRYLVPLNPQIAKQIPVPFSIFYLYNSELNRLMEELTKDFDEIIELTRLAIQNAWQEAGGEKLPLEVKAEIERLLAALASLKVLDDVSNPIDSILADDSQLHLHDEWNAPPITNLMTVLDAILITAEKEISNSEALAGAKTPSSFLKAMQNSLAPLRQAGLLARSFSTDLAPVIRQEVKNTYQNVEQEIKKSAQQETQYWAKDVMNALTVHIINIRDGRALETEAQASFHDLAKVILGITNLASKPLVWRQGEWYQQIAQLQTDILSLDVSEEVKRDLNLALQRIEKGAFANKSAIQTVIQQLYQKIHDAGWFYPSFIEIWQDARERLLQIQGHLFQAIKKRRDDLATVLFQISKAHENAFTQHLYKNIPDGNVKQWLTAKQAELEAILKKQKPELISSQSIEAWEYQYRQFWLSFSQSLDSQCFNAPWHQRKSYEEARRNAAVARDTLSDPKCGEMLFVFGEINKGALLKLLEHTWSKAYHFSVIVQDPSRERVYQALRSQLAGARSSLEAVHYLNSAMLQMESAHATESLAYHIWGRQSRGATVLSEVMNKAQSLSILPRNETLIFSNVIACIKSIMRSYFSDLFFRKPQHQAEVARVLNVVVHEREKMVLLGDKYKQDQAENAIMKEVKKICESLETEHAKRPIVRLAHFVGGNWRDDYLDHWKRVYARLKDQHQLNVFHVEARPEILLKLELTINKIKKLSGIKSFCPGFSDEKERVTTLLSSLKRVIQDQGYDSISVANEFNRVLNGLKDRDQFFFSDFGDIFNSCYEELKSRGLLIYVEPRSLLEEEMGKSMAEIREEAQRYKQGAARLKAKAQTLSKKS